MVSFLLVLCLVAALFAPTVLADNPIHLSFSYGSTKVRGVNLGGWLVLEPWITPSLFDNTGVSAIVDEWTFAQYQDGRTARSALKNHWDSWITEQDFIDIAAAGLNHVRIPIGYWAFEVGTGEPYISGQLSYLQKGVEWARKHGLKVIVDLHGAPGSQNGFDNSGRRISFPEWHSNSTNVARTNAVLQRIASVFAGDQDTVTVIAPLNEPAGFYGDEFLKVLRKYWNDSYETIRFPDGSSKQSDTLVLLHDGFQPLSYWKGFQSPPRYQGVAMDTHIYQMFNQDEVSRTNEQHINSACSHAYDLANNDMWVVVGEWTPAATDCAKYLNGRGVGARYDGTKSGSTKVGSCKGLTGKASSFSSDYKTFLRQYWEAQTITYEKGAGWIQWTWKAEIADEWTYQAGLANGWIPKNPTQRKYPNICS